MIKGVSFTSLHLLIKYSLISVTIVAFWPFSHRSVAWWLLTCWKIIRKAYVDNLFVFVIKLVLLHTSPRKVINGYTTSRPIYKFLCGKINSLISALSPGWWWRNFMPTDSTRNYTVVNWYNWLEHNHYGY